MTNVTKRRMTAAEMVVLREIVRWRRVTGGEYLHHASCLRLGDRSQIAWLATDSYATCMKVGVSRDYAVQPYSWHRIDSVQQGIDLLVALCYLPMRFSSAYRAGYDIGRQHSNVGPGNIAPEIYLSEVPALEAL